MTTVMAKRRNTKPDPAPIFGHSEPLDQRVEIRATATQMDRWKTHAAAQDVSLGEFLRKAADLLCDRLDGNG